MSDHEQRQAGEDGVMAARQATGSQQRGVSDVDEGRAGR